VIPLLILVLLAAALVAFAYFRGVLRPLKTLTAAMQKFAAGDLTSTVDLRASSEWAALSSSFNQMVKVMRIAQDSLEQRVAERTVQLGSANELLRREAAERSHVEAELRASEQRFLLASRATNDCIWDWDLISDQVWVNDAALTQFGHALRLPASSSWWGGNLHPSDSERVWHSIHNCISNGQSFWTEEYRFRRGDGTDA